MENPDESVLRMRDFVGDRKTDAFLAFIEYVTFEYNKINLFFQGRNKCLVLRLRPYLKAFIEKFTKRFLKAPLIEFLFHSELSLQVSLTGNQKNWKTLISVHSAMTSWKHYRKM